MNGHPTRRDFVSSAGSAFGGAWLMRLAPLVAAAQACARDAVEAGATFATFTAREGADFDALAARIVPTDDTPGAREAGSVYFADHALGAFLADLLPIVRAGLSDLGRRATAADPEVDAFAELSEARQDEVIAAVEREDPRFFSMARLIVGLGLVTLPEHGGNRNGIGWDLIGFETAFAYQPPFGFYDRDEHAPPAGGGDGR